MRAARGYCAAESFQLYSVGADGIAGVDEAAKQRDNICSWDLVKSWRVVYHRLQSEYEATGRPDASGSDVRE